MMGEGILFCMGGGGLRAIQCHTGILQACDALGISATRKLCVSGGALVGAFNSIGMDGDDIRDTVMGLKVGDMYRRNWTYPVFSDSLYDNSGMRRILEEYIGDTVLDDVMCAVTDDETNNVEYFPASVPVLMATSAVPGVFPPEMIAGRLKRDGGIMDNIPMPRGIDRLKYDKIIVFVCNEDDSIVSRPSSKVGHILQWMNLTTTREYCQIVNDWQGFDNVCIIKPPPYHSSLYEWSEGFKLIEHARTYSMPILHKFLKTAHRKARVTR